MGVRVQVAPVDLDETPQPGEVPSDYVKRVAREKCAAAVARLESAGAHLPVLAADTTVISERAIVGKAADPQEAAALLRRLAGRRHEVSTAYCIQHGTTRVERTVTTSVTFRLLDPAEVDAYVESGEWRGKAGAYALQGIAGAFVTDVRGSVTNVIGLPLAEVLADLRAVGALASYPRRGFGSGAQPEARHE